MFPLNVLRDVVWVPLKNTQSPVPDHRERLLKAKRPDPNIIRCMVLLGRLRCWCATCSTYTAARFPTWPWPSHMAGFSELNPSTVYWEFHFCSDSKKAFRHRQRHSWPPYSWHLPQSLIWQWFTAHAWKMYIAVHWAGCCLCCDV